jgi:hypothetical protein
LTPALELEEPPDDTLLLMKSAGSGMPEPCSSNSWSSATAASSLNDSKASFTSLYRRGFAKEPLRFRKATLFNIVEPETVGAMVIKSHRKTKKAMS